MTIIIMAESNILGNTIHTVLIWTYDEIERVEGKVASYSFHIRLKELESQFSFNVKVQYLLLLIVENKCFQ